MNARFVFGLQSVIVGASQHTLGDLGFKPFVRHGRHLRDIDELVSCVIKIKADCVFFGHDEIAVGTFASRKFGVEETGTATGKVSFLVVDLAVERALGFVELGGVVGATNFTRFHSFIYTLEKNECR